MSSLVWQTKTTPIGSFFDLQFTFHLFLTFFDSHDSLSAWGGCFPPGSGESLAKSQVFPIVQNSMGQPISITTSSVTTQGTHGMLKSGPGRPKGWTSTVAFEDRPRRLGRPPGTGYLQKARVLSGADAPQPTKRSVGRPRKMQVSPTQATSVVFFQSSFLVHEGQRKALLKA